MSSYNAIPTAVATFTESTPGCFRNPLILPIIPMIGYLNMGRGPEDAVQRNPLKEYTSEFGDPSAFTYGALRGMMIAYVPD